MIANLSSLSGKLSNDAPAWIRIFWASIITLICIELLYAGSFSAMQTAVVLCGLPFSLVIILYIIIFYKELQATDVRAVHSRESVKQDK